MLVVSPCAKSARLVPEIHLDSVMKNSLTVT